jgi:acetoin utilization protein AcuB
MAACPFTIGRRQTLERAHAVMREHGIRHLPVLEGGKLVGLLSLRDLYLIETLRDVNPHETLVEEAMSQDPYVVAPDTPLEIAAATMAQHHYGSAVVSDEHGVVGIFTTVDGMRALADVLHGPGATLH